MVSFICDACGNTVKKTQVEKHYTTVCRSCSVLSCLDCGVDFPGDAYLTHTSCVTEAEKYQGHLYQAKDKENKGETKQKEWLKNVHGTSGQTTDPRLKSLLKKLSAYSNIPRKKKKFDNFCKNSVNVYDAKTLDQLWDLFTGGSETKPTNTEEGKNNSVASEETGTPCVENGIHENGTHENGEVTDVVPTPEVKTETETTSDNELITKKKKKKKKDKQLEIETVAEAEENAVANGVTEDVENETVAKKKKKKKNKTIVCNGDSNNAVITEEPAEPKKKKKKKKGGEESAEILVESQQHTKKSKKSKNKQETMDDTNTLTNGGTERKLGKKSKLKDIAAESELEPNPNKKLKVEGEEEEGVETATPGGKFNWHKTIKHVLKESEDGEISLKKLQKKVLNAYQAHGLDHRAPTINDAMALCDKKIKSYPKAKISKDRVKLVK